MTDEQVSEPKPTRVVLKRIEGAWDIKFFEREDDPFTVKDLKHCIRTLRIGFRRHGTERRIENARRN